MVSRFRQELSSIPAVRIKIGRQGLATTIGWGANGAPGRPLRHFGDSRLSGPLPTDRYLIPGTRKDFGTGTVEAMTSPGLSGLKDLLVATRTREREIKSELIKAKSQLLLAWTIQALGWVSLTFVALKPNRDRARERVANRRAEVNILEGNLDATRISINFDMDSEVSEPHRQMQFAFDQMSSSFRTWSIPTEQLIDRVKARSWAGTVVSRKPVRLQRMAASLVDTEDLPLAMPVLRGKSIAYFYPGFVLVDSGQGSDFALVDMTELQISYTATNFTETEAVPADAQVIGSTWAKANKNGSRDRRFTHNRELPIVRYGSLNLSSPGGMNEAFMLSSADATGKFALAASELKRILARGRPAQRVGSLPRLGQSK